MSTIVPRRLGRKARRTALALTAAALASGALSSSALALPIDNFALSDPANTFQLAGFDPAVANCAAGQAPLTDAELNWRQAGMTVQPRVKGTICLQNSFRETRFVLEYRDNADLLIARYPSNNTLVGIGAALQTVTATASGPVVNSAAMSHVHIVLQERVVGAANWNTVATAYEWL